MVGGQLRFISQIIERRQPGQRPVAHTDSDRPVQCHDRGGAEPEQFVVQTDHRCPVGACGVFRGGVDSRQVRLDPITAPRRAGQLRQGEGLGDCLMIPADRSDARA